MFGFGFVVRDIQGIRHRLHPGGVLGNVIRRLTSQDSHRCDMGKKTYWDDFYAKRKAASDQPFDWFFSHDVANQWLAKYICPERTTKQTSQVMNILELGCGTSTLSSSLLTDNSDIVSVASTDFSWDAVRQAQLISKKTCPSKKKSVHFVVADASRLPFRSNQFDLVFEKGTFDAMLNSQNCNVARTSFGETVRVLKPRGIFLQFSDENPDARLTFLEEALRLTDVDRNQASITLQDIGCSFGTEYFLYVIKLSQS